MLKLKNSLLIPIYIIILCTSSNAMPSYVTIEGNQNSPFPGPLQDLNHIKIILSVDPNRQGMYSTIDRVDSEFQDYYEGDVLVDSFFVDLIYFETTYGVSEWGNQIGSLDNTDQSIKNACTNIPNSIFGYTGNVLINDIDNNFKLILSVEGLTANCIWLINQGSWAGYLGVTEYNDISNEYNSIWSSGMYISDVSTNNPINPVPEPSTFLIIAMGSLVIISKKHFLFFK